MRAQEEIMREAGYVTAADAARATGQNNIGTVHRAVKTNRMVGARAGKHWYVSVASLLKEYAQAEPILDRIKALGVEPNPDHLNPKPKPKEKEKRDGKQRAQRSARG